MKWLPDDKRAAVCLTVDDVHPHERAIAALSHVRSLQDRHPRLRATLFTTPDWRSIVPRPSRLVRHVPLLRDHVYTVPLLPRGSRRLDRFPDFCEWLRTWPGAEIALHGLHHAGRGMMPVAEFARRGEDECAAMLRHALQLFADAGLPVAPGMCPPGWHATVPLLAAMEATGFRFVASARDLTTPISPGAMAGGSGLHGVSLIFPDRAGALVHFTTNYQATSTRERAFAILDAGGLLCIKAHLLDRAGDYVALDGLTSAYEAQLDELFTAIDARHGGSLWWTSMGEIAERIHGD